ncbi:ATP-binding protein [Streptomyces sp. LX-29]|uniref:ATP-binding protein n=1 Tax=Streptomyces sp. LX-29 TaxID=2900152 RepID=UPI00240DF43D|nr:ATP-binding protein [Streptomyces sp. LX-29]WFB06991.1 ATP-binding protein [Streptomyces sp. LX-29]
MTDHISEVVTWCLGAALLVALVLLLRQRQITTSVRKHSATLEGNLRARDEEIQHLVSVRLPAVADSVGRPVPLPGLRDERLAGTAYAQSLQLASDLFAKAVDKAQAKADVAAKAALKASMRALQGLAHEQQLSISEMQDRHDNPDVLRDLLEIDHANSQFGRRAQAIAVLCGSWPGRQRAASSLTDVVRGATSRIRDYRRVQVHTQIDIAVVSRAVEPVVLAVAELLDNAARHSQPNTKVEVSLQPVHNGACVVIDDAGVGMDGQEVKRAQSWLAAQRPVDVARLGDPPQFGFPVIGVLAARYGFSVSVDTRSPYGGVRAVLFLPSALLTHLEDDRSAPMTAAAQPTGASAAPAGQGRHAAPRPAAHEAQPATRPAAPQPASPLGHPPLADDVPRSYPSTAGGLPKRRRRQPTAATQERSLTPASDDWPIAAAQRAEAAQAAGAEESGTGSHRVRSAEETARRMGAFARGTRSGRAEAPDEAPHHDEGNRQA